MERPTDQQIRDAQADAAYQAVEHGGSKWPGMSYEQGVDAALSWVLGESSDHPMEDG